MLQADVVLRVGPFQGHVDFLVHWLRKVARIPTPCVLLPLGGAAAMPSRDGIHLVYR